MSQATDYEIVEVVGRGKLMLAARDLLPGSTVISKEAPIMFIPEEYAAQYKGSNEIVVLVLAGYSIYNKFLPDANKSQFDTLFGPVTGPHVDNLRQVATEKVFTLAPDGVTYKAMSLDEVEKFLRIASILVFNAFAATDGGYVVMNEITRMSHSCLPNCKVDITSTSGTCRTILPVKKGEELTVEYVKKHRLKPTHFRRHRYLERKAFTCHCPRCSADADDTREFDCFDPQCPGSCFACQPMNKEALALPGLQYTGVEYVEPHLLPCTVCHRAPPLKYQQDMFALEKRLPEIAADWEKKRQNTKHELRACVALQREIANATFPRRHSLSIPLLKIRYQLNLTSALCGDGKRYGGSEAARTFQEYLELHERLIRFPTDVVADRFCDALQLRRFLPEGMLPLHVLKEWGQKGVRMYLIVHGRDTRNKLYDDLLVEVLQRLPPQPAITAQCMFCGESPLRAALTLRRCGRCKQVSYCSAGCQKAHWPLHKKCCKQA